jgi:hypothetical protein
MSQCSAIETATVAFAREAVVNTLNRTQRNLILLFLVACHVAMVAVVVPRLVRDVRTVQYPFAEGVIAVSEPRDLPLSKMNYWKLEYTYTVDGRTYTGTRYSFTGDDRYFRDDLLRILAKFPVGGRVSVAYNPDDPADAALRPTQPGHLFEWVGILLAGTAGALLAVLAVLFAGAAPRLFNPDDERCVAHMREGPLVRLRATFVIHPTVTMSVLLGLIVLIVFLRPTVHDPYPWWAGFSIVVCAPALVITMLALTRHPTLLVDEDRQRLLFTPGRPWANVELAFSDVIDVRVTPLTTTLKNGSTTTIGYKVTLTHTVRGVQRDLILCDYFNRGDADALVAWLRDRLGSAVPAELPLS